MASRGNTWRCAAVIFLHSYFLPFSRHVSFLFVDFVGDLYVPPNYFEEHLSMYLLVNWLHWP